MQNGIGYQLNRVMWKTIKKNFCKFGQGFSKRSNFDMSCGEYYDPIVF